jgi:hypothetical protein
VGVLLETFTIFGLVLGALCFVISMAVRAADGDWIETTAVIVPEGDSGPQALLARWMAHDGSLHSRRLHDHEIDEVHELEAFPVFYSRDSPHRMRFGRKNEAARIFWLLFIVLAGVGLLCLGGSALLTLAVG